MRLLPEGDLEAAINHAVTQDFASGKICRIDGWQLSATECRLAGIAYFYKANGGYIESTASEAGPLDALPETAIAEVERWGPQFTAVGKPFNPRPDGGSAIWLHSADLTKHTVYKIYLGIEEANTFVNRAQKLITGSLSAEQTRLLVSKPGKIALYLVDPVRGKQLVGHMAVLTDGRTERAESAVVGDQGEMAEI